MSSDENSCRDKQFLVIFYSLKIRIFNNEMIHLKFL